jgi:hypothetical protein
MRQRINSTLWVWLVVLRLHLPGAGSPSALQLVRSVQLDAILALDHLLIRHNSTRKATLRRLGWAVEAGLLTPLPEGPPSNTPIFMLGAGGSRVRIKPYGPMLVRAYEAMRTIERSLLRSR